MKNISFSKMSGAGNDFIIFDKKINPGLNFNSAVIKKLCNRRNGIGADGVITISDNDKYDFIMEYFNADGSTGSLCGNGSRCAIKFARETGRVKNNVVNFKSNDSIYSGKIINENTICFFLGEPGEADLNININAYGQNIKANFINTGSPHVVISVEDILKDPLDTKSGYMDINDMPVFEIGGEIRYLNKFAPEGTNVNFIKVKNGKIFIRTYERGVENETLSCGTGAAACAIIAFLVYGVKPPVTLHPRGEEELMVDFNITGNKIENLSLTGPAKVIFTGEISETVFS